MKIVIDINEKDYDFINNTSFVEDEGLIIRQTREDRKKTMILFDILDAVRNGTPLPEHHGRLISEEDMLSVIMFSKLFDDAKVGEVKKALLNIPTIIEGE